MRSRYWTFELIFFDRRINMIVVLKKYMRSGMLEGEPWHWMILKLMMPKTHLVKVNIQFLLQLPQILLLRLGWKMFLKICFTYIFKRAKWAKARLDLASLYFPILTLFANDWFQFAKKGRAAYSSHPNKFVLILSEYSSLLRMYFFALICSRYP